VRRIAVINQKGGVGKTTTTANLGGALARAGWRVLLIDLDPQSHLSLHLGVELSDGQFSIYDVLTASTPIASAAKRIGHNMTLVPADIDLAGADAELISVTGREVILREALDALEDEYDVLLIDCPPALGVLTVNALAAVFEVVIPLQAHFFALQGLGKLLNTITLVRQRINTALRVGGVVLCMHEASTRLATEVVDDLRGFLSDARDKPVAWAGARIYPVPIRRNIKLAESPSYGQTVFDYAPRSNGAYDYAKLAEDMFGVDANLILPGIGTFERFDDVQAQSPQPRPFEPPLSAPLVDQTESTPTSDLAGTDAQFQGR
jgi:chromosome partitioning protein